MPYMIDGVQVPHYPHIQKLCTDKMIIKAKTKGNTWHRPEYVRKDFFLYEEMLRHAAKLDPVHVDRRLNRKDTYFMTPEQLISNAVDVINFNAMIIDNCETFECAARI